MSQSDNPTVSLGVLARFFLMTELTKKLSQAILVLTILHCTAKEPDNEPAEAHERYEAMFPTERITIDSMKKYCIAPKPFTRASVLHLAKDSDHWHFRTRYREGFKKPADFAGKFKVVQWGCGSNCQVSSLINLEKGTIIDGFTTSMGVEYRIDSTIFIVDPFSAEEFQYGRPTLYEPARIYNFDGKEFHLLKEPGFEIKEVEE
jgi:hypothetical protein